MQKRLFNSEIIGLPSGTGNYEELTLWIESHYEMLRSYFRDKNNFLEIDIENNNTSNTLQEKIGIKIRWWGVENANPPR